MKKILLLSLLSLNGSVFAMTGSTEVIISDIKVRTQQTYTPLSLKDFSLKKQLEELLSLSYDSYALMIERKIADLRSDPLRELEASCLTDCVNQKELAFQIIFEICRIFKLLDSSDNSSNIAIMATKETQDEIEKLPLIHITDTNSNLYNEILKLTDSLRINNSLYILLTAISFESLIYTSAPYKHFIINQLTGSKQQVNTISLINAIISTAMSNLELSNESIISLYTEISKSSQTTIPQ